MSMAFQAAGRALGPLTAWSRGEAGWQQTRQALRRRLGIDFRRRLLAAGLLHRVLLDTGLREALASLAGTGALPFRRLLPLVR
jgi:hypothetical protein